MRGATIGLMLAGVAALALIVIGVVGLIAARHPSSGAAQGSASAPSSTPGRSSTSGWRQQESTRYGYAYQVPAGWTVMNPDTAVGFQGSSGQRTVAVTAATSYREGYCQGAAASSRATTGFQGAATTDLGTLATSGAQQWAVAAYAPPPGSPAPGVSVSQAKAITIAGMKAVEATAKVTTHGGSRCDPPNAIIYAVALPGRNGGPPVSFVIVSDQGTSDAASEADLQRIVNSIRPIGSTSPVSPTTPTSTTASPAI